MFPNGESTGHYICDIKEKYTNSWYQTNDSEIPKKIDCSEVTKDAYVILYRNYEL